MMLLCACANSPAMFSPSPVTGVEDRVQVRSFLRAGLGNIPHSVNPFVSVLRLWVGNIPHLVAETFTDVPSPVFIPSAVHQ